MPPIDATPDPRARDSTPGPRARVLALVFLFLLTLAAPAAAQAGALLVRVRSGDDPVAGASVELAAGDRTRTSVTDTAGTARFVGLPDGRYRVRVEAFGYRPFEESEVEVSSARPTTLEVDLDAAPVELDRIQVRADAVQIQRDNTDFSTTVGEAKMEMLPLLYDPAEVVALTPGARAGHVWGGANFQANSYQVDGLSASHPGLGGLAVEPSRLWIERVEVRGLGAGAEHGGFQGGQVNVVTKSGSNEFRGTLRSSVENDALTASNLVSTEVGTEVSDRYQLEGEVAGALVPDRLFYYLGAERIDGTARALNHIGGADSRYSPLAEERQENKVFGKLTWRTPGAGQLDLSGGYLDTRVDNYGLTGYEAADAASRYTSPTWFANVSWAAGVASWLAVEARLNHFGRDERTGPYGGADTPGIRFFAVTPPYTEFGNAPFSLRSAPSSTSGRVTATAQFTVVGQRQSVTVGSEHSRGRFLEDRSRNGGMTWLPVRSAGFDDGDPTTWPHVSLGFTPTAWGGEVHLDADVARTSHFVQTALAIGPRIVLTPGLRWGRWQGWLDPADGARFRAVEDAALDPRIGAIVSLDREGSYVVKGHWGRYHQDLMTQMFDRAEGGDVFTNEEIWYYDGDPAAAPGGRFTRAERDALAAEGLFRHESTIVLNETGPVVDYRQPYIDQWLVGFEKQWGSSVKLELLYTRRTNHDMIALVDRNRGSNYTRFGSVQVLDAGGTPLPFSGGMVYLEEIYIPNWRIRDQLEFCATAMDVCAQQNMMPPGFSVADTASLGWDPDYVLTTAPDAQRTFGQLQATVDVVRPRWGGSFSLAFTDLQGNLDNVTGYADPAEYDAGPYVRVNEHINSYGTLPNFSEQEAKVSAWMIFPGEVRGGLFFTSRTGDHYSPHFRVSGIGFFRYRANYRPGRSDGGDPLDYQLMGAIEGQEVFIGPRGLPHMKRRANWDLRLSRLFEVGGTGLELGLDLFNVLGSEAVTELNTMVNNGRDYYAHLDGTGLAPWRSTPSNQYYRATLERTRPRTLRFTLTARF